MKKFFTLIAIALCAISANAQEVVAIDASGSYSDGQTLSTANCSVTLGNDMKKWTVKSDALDPFTAYVSGGNNPKDDNSTAYSPATMNLPTNGCYYVLAPKADGTLTVGVVLNADKAFYVAMGDGLVVDNTDLTLVDKSGSTVTLDDDNKVSDKFYGKITLAVAKNTSYYVFCNGSKLGFYGYEFTPGDTNGISNVNAAVAGDNAPMYNLAGQKVGNDFKGIVVKNGKKFVNK